MGRLAALLVILLAVASATAPAGSATRTTAASPAEARELAVSHDPTLTDALRQTVTLSGGPGSRLSGEQHRYFIALNKSALVDNGLPGLRMLSEIRGLLNEFLVQGEDVHVHLFQLGLQDEISFSFKPEERQRRYGDIQGKYTFGVDQDGGSDLEEAEYTVLSALTRGSGPGFAVVMSNQPTHQVSAHRGKVRQPWVDQTSHRAEVAELAELKRRYPSRRTQFEDTGKDNRRVKTWVTIWYRGDTSGTPIRIGREQQVRDQNASSRRVPDPTQPGSNPSNGPVSPSSPQTPPAVHLILDKCKQGEAPDENTVHLEWEKVTAPHTSYQVLMRDMGTPPDADAGSGVEPPAATPGEPKALADITTEQTDVTLPATGSIYQLTVVARNRETAGPESQPLRATSKTEPANVLGPVLAGLGALLLAALLWLVLRTETVIVETEKRLLGLRNAGIAVGGAGFAGKKKGDVELPAVMNLLPDQPLAELQRDVLGKITLRGAPSIKVKSGTRLAPTAELKSGTQNVILVSTRENGREIPLKIQVGSSPRAVTPKANRGSNPRPPAPPRPGGRPGRPRP